MNNDIEYIWGEQNLTVKLGTRLSTQLRFWYLFELLLSLSIASLFLLQSFSLKNAWLCLLCLAGSGILYIISFYRFVSKRFLKEELVVSKEVMTIINKTPFYKKSSHYFFKYMGPWHYIGQDVYYETNHYNPSKNILGINRPDTLLSGPQNGGHVIFNYKGFTINFGKGIHSRQAEDMLQMIQLFSGNKVKLGMDWLRMLEQPQWQEQDKETDSNKW